MLLDPGPLGFSRGEDMVEFVASRRQGILEILGEFQVVSSPHNCHVARYSLIESKGHVALIRCGLEESSKIHELTNHSPVCGRNA